MEEKSDHDLLLGLVKDSCWTIKILSNHLKHHWLITLAACAAAMSAFATIIILLVMG